jgi:hypothetical protein
MNGDSPHDGKLSRKSTLKEQNTQISPDLGQYLGGLTSDWLSD